MADLIDRDALINLANSHIDHKVSANDIARVSTVDAVPVVLCKDCVYYQYNNGGYPNLNCRWAQDETPNEDDFCSYGERRYEI